jgi:hypothetical protein
MAAPLIPIYSYDDQDFESLICASSRAVVSRKLPHTKRRWDSTATRLSILVALAQNAKCGTEKRLIINPYN